MVSRRRSTSSPRFKLAAALFLPLAALALASGAYLGTAPKSVSITDKTVLSGIAPIYRQISEQAGQATPVNGNGSLSAENAPFAAAFLRLGEYAEEADTMAALEADPAASGFSPGGVAVTRIGGAWSPAGAARRMSMPEDMTGAAALVFNNSFSSLFSKIFDPQAEDASRSAELSAESRNPFAEIKQKEDAARLAATETAQGTQDKAVAESKPAEPASLCCA